MPIYINNKLVPSSIFPGGECHICIDKSITPFLAHEIWIMAFLYNSDDIIQLILTINAIKANHANPIWLMIPYLPYARQDRICQTGESFSLKIMADIINGLNVTRVTIIDPHSAISSALINNCSVFDQFQIITGNIYAKPIRDLIRDKMTALIAPDVGSYKKVKRISQYFNKTFYLGIKERNEETGKISYNESLWKSDQWTWCDAPLFLVIDDICDGGATFISLAQMIKNKFSEVKLYLYVTHAIFSNGLDELLKYYETIYCYHKFPNVKPHEKLIILREFP